MYQPKTGAPCGCRRGVQRDNCPTCEGTGMQIDFRAIRARASSQSDQRPLPARYEGLQHFPGLPSFALWTIWEPLPGHPVGSTVSDTTIRALGYEPINTEEPK